MAAILPVEVKMGWIVMAGIVGWILGGAYVLGAFKRDGLRLRYNKEDHHWYVDPSVERYMTGFVFSDKEQSDYQPEDCGLRYPPLADEK